MVSRDPAPRTPRRSTSAPASIAVDADAPAAAQAAAAPLETVAPVDRALVEVPAALLEAGVPTVRVRVASAAPGAAAAFGLAGAYRVLAPRDGGRLLARGERLPAAEARASGAGVQVTGEAFDLAAVSFVPERNASLSVLGRTYRGALDVEAEPDGALALVNVVGLEDYLKGVLLAEMPEGFGMEALRAQAVASRTYALYHALLGHTLRADQGSQVYTGSDGESAAARAAVDSTRGEVLAVGDAVFQAFFHSTCGGTTSSAADVFRIPAPPPIATPVRCTTCADAPRYRWSVTLGAERLPEAVPGARSIEVVSRDAGERVLEIALLDASAAEVGVLPADTLRNKLNSGRPLSQQVLSTLFTRIARLGGGALALDGRGFGHGVGLCQYGARGLARAGETYRRILERYYPGSGIRRLYD
jgi:stage II sporulation protein D